MPVKIPETLPAKEILESENIFVMGEGRALHQDIRPLKIAILNLMPTKIETETQLCRLIGNTPLQVDITLLHTRRMSRKTPRPNTCWIITRALQKSKIRNLTVLIITGAPVEHLPFEEVDYWHELQAIMDWAETHVYSTYFICWGAQAGLYHRYGIPKYPIPAKMFGVFPHRVLIKNEKLLRGFDDEFMAPHSRHTEIRRSDIEPVDDLKILAESPEAGVYIVASKNGRRIYVTGHSEYDPLTLTARIRTRSFQGAADFCAEKLFPRRRPQAEPARALARACQSAVRQLAKLSRLPAHPL